MAKFTTCRLIEAVSSENIFLHYKPTQYDLTRTKKS